MKNSSDTFRTQLHHEATGPTLSRNAKQRLKWMQHYQKYRNARLTCRHFGISPDTFYLWKNRFNTNNLTALEDDFKNRRPHHLRKPKHLASQGEVLALQGETLQS